MKLSIITTTKSDTKNIVRLAQSLYPIYNKLYEFIIVDAGTPNLTDIADYSFGFPKIINGIGTTRGEGKNIGIKKAGGDVIIFLNDDVEITDEWLTEVKKSLRHSDIVAGYSLDPNRKMLARVPIYINGQDATWPTCNIIYKKEVFDKVGYFDEKMITAEDVEFNCRCIKQGYVIHYNPKMFVYHYQRETIKGFIKQAFWNGYGRKQFNRLHPDLKYEHQHGIGFKSVVRLGFGFLGYVLGDLFGKNR